MTSSVSALGIAAACDADSNMRRRNARPYIIITAHGLIYTTEDRL